MARPKATHIKNPEAKRESLCWRKSVDFAKNNSDATCKTCQRLAVDGTLRGKEWAANASKWEGYNNTGEPKFTEKQVAFAEHPKVMVNAKQAAIDAGYSPSFAKSQAKALRKQLAPLIMEYQERAKQIAAISVAAIQTELAGMGFANILDYFIIREDGAMRPKQLNELTRSQASAVQEVKVIETEDPLTGETRTVIGYLKLADKRANLVELGKTLGMFNKLQIEDKREVATLMKEVPTEALEKAENILMDAVAMAREQRSQNEAVEGEFTKLPSPVEESK